MAQTQHVMKTDCLLMGSRADTKALCTWSKAIDFNSGTYLTNYVQWVDYQALGCWKSKGFELRRQLMGIDIDTWISICFGLGL